MTRQPPVYGLMTRREQLAVSVTVRVHVEIDTEQPLRPVDFRVDSGSSCSIIREDQANAIGLPIPTGRETTIVQMLANGHRKTIRVRPSKLRVWGNDRREGIRYSWRVLYQMIDAPIPPGAVMPPPLLGLGGVLHSADISPGIAEPKLMPQCRWTFDPTPHPNSPHGTFTLEDVR